MVKTLPILRNRKRPKNATPLVRETWGNKYEMKLYIPDFINGYNYSMNGVDLADQSRQECPTKRPRMYRTWKPCWHYLFDTTLCNAAHIFNACGHFNLKSKADLNLTFRKALECITIDQNLVLYVLECTPESAQY
jgi:hypothetical protein